MTSESDIENVSVIYFTVRIAEMLTIPRLILTAKKIPIIAVHGSGYRAVCEGVDDMVIITVYDQSLDIKLDYLIIKQFLGPGHPVYRCVRPQRVSCILPVNLMTLLVAVPEWVQCLCG